MAEPEKNWERETLEKLAFSALKEQRRARYWGIFFKLLTFAYVTFLLVMLFEWRGDGDLIGDGKHTALVELEGVIDVKSDASAEKITAALQGAFKDKNTQGVILRINSPGGSPVQSGIINDEVRRLRGTYPNTPLYVVVEDICASGGYFVAASADKIYVNKASLVGSIGVLMDGFGFTGGMEKLGVERRLLTAGENKGFMDPFSPVDAKQKEYALSMLNDIHQQFIAVVKQGRGKRLKDNPELFSGLIWTGQKAVELGLADGFGSVESVARDVIKAESIVDYTQKSNPVERIAKRFGAAAAKSFAEFTLRESIRLR
jgi:protease-4